MLAVIQTGGKQYTVAKDKVIKVEKLDLKAGDTLTIDQVLMVNDGKKTTIGAPTVAGAKVQATVVDQIRDRKIIVFKKKRRHNYRRKNGHRQHLTILKVTGITTGSAGKAKKESEGSDGS